MQTRSGPSSSENCYSPPHLPTSIPASSKILAELSPGSDFHRSDLYWNLMSPSWEYKGISEKNSSERTWKQNHYWAHTSIFFFHRKKLRRRLNSTHKCATLSIMSWVLLKNYLLQGSKISNLGVKLQNTQSCRESTGLSVDLSLRITNSHLLPDVCCPISLAGVFSWCVECC